MKDLFVYMKNILQIFEFICGPRINKKKYFVAGGNCDKAELFTELIWWGMWSFPYLLIYLGLLALGHNPYEKP